MPSLSTSHNSLKSTDRVKNESELKTIEDKIEDAVKNAGDTEVIDGLFSKARYLAKIGDWTESEKIYDEILSKPKTVTGRKIDANMEKARLAFFSLVSLRTTTNAFNGQTHPHSLHYRTPQS